MLVGIKSGILPTKTTYGASFVFACQPGFTLMGNNSDAGKNVKCLENGRWDLGGLRCIGKEHER